MIVSMTGYGQGEASNASTTVTAEIRSVNHRFLDFSFKLPRALQPRERDIRELLKKKMTRGRVYVTVTVESEKHANGVSINQEILSAYLEQLRTFAAEHKLRAEIDMNTLVQLPDVVSAREAEPDEDTVWPLAEKSLNQALDRCHTMRIDEGRALATDLTARMEAMDRVVAEIEKLAPDVSKKHAEAFRKRIAQLMGDVKIDEDRLTAEIAVLADRLDFTEEIAAAQPRSAVQPRALRRRRGLEEAHVPPPGDAPRGLDHRREGVGFRGDPARGRAQGRDREDPRAGPEYRIGGEQGPMAEERTSYAFPVVISGPSGVGKTTLIERLLERDPLLRESISVTTRAAREGEKTGEDYFFVIRDVFEEMKERELVEWAEVHGELYGTPRRFIENEIEEGHDVVLNIDIQGGDSVKKAFPNALMVFMLPPSFESLEERMRGRGAVDQDDLARRIANARKEIKASNNYDYIVVNDDLETAVGTVAAIITAERHRRERLKPETVKKRQK